MKIQIKTVKEGLVRLVLHKVAFVSVLSICALSSLAQDVMHMSSGESILAEIQEIGVETVSYKEADLKDGPLRLLLISELDSIVLKNGSVHRYENKPTSNDTLKTEVKAEPRTMIFDVSGGVAFFINNIYNKKIKPGPSGQLKFAQQFSKSMSYFIKADVSQSSSAFEERSLNSNLNALNTILAYGVSSGVEYNIVPYSKLSESKKVKWHPYILAGIGFKAGMNHYYADVQDQNGNVYYYWDDGTIRNVDQSSPVTDDIRVLERDFLYETRLNEFPVASYAVSVPVEFGLRVRITSYFGLNLAFSTSTDIIVNEVSQFTNKENRFNLQMMGSIGVSIFIH